MKSLGRVILTIFILVIAGTMIFFSFEENQKWFVRYLDSFSTLEKEVVEIRHIPGEGIKYINGRYLAWNGEKMSVSDESGKILWERTFLMDDPRLVINDNLIGVFDRVGGEGVVINFNGQILTQIKEKAQIFSFRPGKEGHIVHIKEEGRDLLKIYGVDGEHRENLIFTNNYPIDYSLEADGVKVTILELQDKGIGTKLVKYTSEGEAELYDLRDLVIIKVLSVGNDRLIVTEAGIYLEMNGQVVWGRELPLLKDVLVDGNEIYAIYGDNLRILNKEGKTIHEATFGIDYVKLHAHGKYIILAGEKDLLVFRHMEQIASHSFNWKIVDLQSQFNDLIVTTENGVNIVRIEDKEVVEEDIQ
ncbi:DUF5711 family protein [Gudongella sp. SC589]|jgi:hypothetical protein|uniref:DUF5711 family protein n=1 Tax=Gudongella sp. SC589 TaxID=3385990 RepID=UPI0039048149